MSFDAVGFDYDGTLVDSKATAFSITDDIASLFDIHTKTTSMKEYRSTFQLIENRYVEGTAQADLLRELHRLLMATHGQAVPIIQPVIDLMADIAVETVVITSGLRRTVLNRIGDRLNNDRRVLGHEDGLKENTLAQWSTDRRCLYVTDNVVDIQRCRKCGVSVAAVGWGFDSSDDLVRAKPDWMVDDAHALKSLLGNLTLLRTSI